MHTPGSGGHTKAEPSPIPMSMVVGGWLTYSETFIYDQLQHQHRLRTQVLAYQRSPAADWYPYDPVVTLGPLERIAYFGLGYSPRFLRHIRAHGARLIHAHFGTNGTYAAPLAKAQDCPLAVTFHGHDVAGLLPRNRYTWRYALYQRTAPKMFDQASVLLCSSQELADTLVEEVGAPAHKIRIHRLGVNLDQFPVEHRDDGPPRVVMVGRFVEKKGFEYALRALAEVRRDAPDLSARMVGDGPLANELRALVEDLGLGDAVTFCGILDHAGVRRELAAADVLLAPSVVGRDGDRESGVIVIKEASASGIPTVGTLHGGIPEIIEDGATGFLVPERDVGALADGLRTLVLDGSLRRRFGAAARAKIEREYDTVKQNATLEKILISLL